MTMRRTKIVATLGPASANERVLRELIKTGLDVARLNFSHGDHSMHQRTLDLVRRLAAEENRPVAILQDLGGPKIRTGIVADQGSLPLREGDRLFLLAGSDVAEPGRIGISYSKLPSQCPPGARIFMDDGLIELRALSCGTTEVECLVVRGGDLRSRKGVNLPGAKFEGLPALTDKDKIDLAWGLEHGVDFVALSFVREPADVQEVQALVRHAKTKPHVIAKIEKPQALDHIHGILAVSDGIMVARGDLGVELDPEQVPLAQKDLIRLANAHERPVITATQMLEPMTKPARPTRAEVNDVANAIFDGTDAVMLSAETASGQFPVLALGMMARIAEAADDHIARHSQYRHREAMDPPDTVLEAVGRAAELLARELHVRVIVTATLDGQSALGISKSRPEAALYALSPDPAILRRMNLYWGTIPLPTGPLTSRMELSRQAEKVAIDQGLAQPGDFLVLVSSSPIDAPGDPNNLRLHRIGAERTGDTALFERPTF